MQALVTVQCSALLGCVRSPHALFCTCETAQMNQSPVVGFAFDALLEPDPVRAPTIRQKQTSPVIDEGMGRSSRECTVMTLRSLQGANAAIRTAFQVRGKVWNRTGVCARVCARFLCGIRDGMEMG
jgi:hypothetical protein